MEEGDQGGKRTWGGSGYFNVPIADTAAAAAARHRIRRVYEFAGLFATCTLRSAPTSLFPPSHTLPPPPSFALLHTPTGESGRHVTQKEDAVGTAKPLAGAPRLVVRCSAHQPRPATSGSTPTDGRANAARLPLALVGRGSTPGSMPPAAGDQQEHPDWWPRL